MWVPKRSTHFMGGQMMPQQPQNRQNLLIADENFSLVTPLLHALCAKDPCLFASKVDTTTHQGEQKMEKFTPERKCEKTVWEFLMNCLTSGQFTGSLVVVKFVTRSIPRESSFA